MSNEREVSKPRLAAARQEPGRTRSESGAKAGTVPCAACREPIAAGSRICPHCKTRQSLLSVKAQAVRWTAAALTVATLVLGLREGVDLVATRIENRTVLKKHLAAAANLLDAREYRTAWDLTEAAAKIAPQNRRLRNARLAIARAWLLDAHTFGSERGFLDIVDRVVPFLSATEPSLSLPERAELLALLAFAERLRERSEKVRLNVAGLYQKAVDTDPTCALAHLLMGHDLSAWGADLPGALPHLALAAERAGAGDLEPGLFRRYQFSALAVHLHHHPKHTARLAAVELLRAVNDVRRKEERLPIDPARLYFGQSTLWNDLELIHRQAALEPDETAHLSRALPAAEHLALLEWIRDNRPKQLRIDGIHFWIAMILEQQQDTRAAAAALHNIPSKGLYYRLAPLVDQAHIRLTGRPHRPLEEQNPWAWRIEVLSEAQPGAPDFNRAADQVSTAADSYHSGRQHNRDQLLAALKAADRSWRQTLENDKILSEASLETWWKLRFDLGVTLRDKGLLDEALSILSDLADRLKPGHVLRGRVLVETAAAHARIAASSEDPPDGHTRSGTALLVQAVETEDYVDWARLRWHSDLAPLRETTAFGDLLKRHGRSPSTAGKGLQNAN